MTPAAIFALVKAPVSDPRSQNWQEVIPERSSVMLEDTDFFKNYYVLYERENGLPQIRVTDLRSGQSRGIEFPEPAYDTGSDINLRIRHQQVPLRVRVLRHATLGF